MLVLTRKNRESVVVGDPSESGLLLKVTVLQVKGNKVMLGIEGDRSIPVYRCEIWDRIRREKKQGSQQYCA
ncbi:MAG TPA: carbon storage regulator [Lacipirellulaceae bacterium]|nr:carbon storage regulator [Lacipirellulaceae bacterium]